MIRSFKHKGLEAFAKTGDRSKLPVANHKKVARILHLIQAVERPTELHAFGSFRFHIWHNYTPVRYSLDVNGPWRVTFAWEGSDAIDVDIEQPH